MYTIDKVSKIISAACFLARDNAAVKHLATDSRRITFAKDTLFFAIKTVHRDGASYVEDAYLQGVRSFVVQEKLPFDTYPEADFLLVQNTLQALQLLAQYHREQFQYPVVGITGSNGKTIVKEWLYFILNERYSIVRSPRSYNSQIGVPLSVWEMDKENNLAIFEAGISEVNEMQTLQKIIQPEIGIITNIGDAHNAGFVDKKQKLCEKLLLFKEAKIIFANANDSLITTTLAELGTIPVFTFGKNDTATLFIKAMKTAQDKTIVEALYQKEQLSIVIPFTDEASVQNVLFCWCVALYLKIENKFIQEKILQLQAIDMRLQVLPAVNNCTVINDSYSLDIDSLNVALDLLNQQLLPKTLILSDFYNADIAEYNAVKDLLVNKNINRLITIGKQWDSLKPILNIAFERVENYLSSEDFLAQFRTGQYKNEAILLKGARLFEFEKIFNQLIEKVHQTRLEINLSNIVHNLKEYKKHLKPTTKVMAMVKAFAYGSGSVEIASILQYHKVDYLAVAYADEGVELRNAGIKLPIMVMNADAYGFETIVQHSLEPEIYSFKILNELAEFLHKQGITQFPIHLKIETGMHRLGFEETEIDALLLQLNRHKIFIVKSVFSHLAASEDAVEDAFTLKQAAIFERCCTKLEAHIHYDFIKHLCNSAAIARHPNLHFDMVRLGIGLYGVNTTNEYLNLKTVAALKTTIAQIKNLQPSDTVGYNRKGKITKPTVSATIRIGYADGYNRRLGNGKGYVLIKNKPAPIIGIVCMDMMMVDITSIESVHEGDEVEVFGENLSIEQLAKWSDTNAYEIFTSVGQRVKRVYFEE